MGNCCGRKRRDENISGGTGNFAKDFLNEINKYRAKHGVPRMTLSKKLVSDAQKWANHLAQAGKLEHSKSRDGAGENLAWGSAEMSAQEATKLWYDEIKDYDYNSPGFRSGTGHFTQVVWKSSTEFGGAFAKSSTGGTYVVGRFYPQGNINTREEFQENVPPPK